MPSFGHHSFTLTWKMSLGSVPLIIFAVRITLAFLGTFMNTLNIIVLCMFSKDINQTSQLVINLAFADVTVCLSDFGSILLFFILPRYYFATKVCVISFYKAFQAAGFLVTLFAVAFIAVNNYVMVLKPLRYRMIITRRLVKRSVIMFWILSFSTSVLIVVLPVLSKERSQIVERYLNSFKIYNDTRVGNVAHNKTILTYTQDYINNNTLLTRKEKYVHSNTLLTHTEKYVYNKTLLTQTEKYENLINEVNILSENTSHSSNIDGFKSRNSELIALWNRLESFNSTDFTFCEQMVLSYSMPEFTYILSFLGVLFCIILLIIVYSRICCEISALSRRSQEMTGHRLRQRKTTMTTFLIVFSFILCWLPGSMLYFAFGDSISDPSILSFSRTMFILQLVNTIFDAMLYALRLPEVRVCFGKLKAWCCSLR